MDDYFGGAAGFSEDGSLKGSFAVLANDPGGAALHAVHSTASVPAAGRHGAVNAPKAAITIVHDGVSYVGYASIGSNGKVDVDFSSLNGAIDTLAAGEQLSASFYYTVKLSNGSLSTAKATFTITGENDGATITGQAAGSVTEDGTTFISGALAVHDVDHGEARFQTPGSLAGTYGAFTFDAATGAWTYTLDNDAEDVQALNEGDVVYDTLTVTSLDGSASRTITVTINGADDAHGIAAFITGGTNPWGNTSYDVSMDTVFGEGNWDKFNDTAYENIFDDGYEFIWLDGSAGNTDWFHEYVDTYRDEIEDYVSQGGTLYINAARWEDENNNYAAPEDFDLGFGVTLIFDERSAGNATEDADLLVNGPHGNAGTSWSGGYFSHDQVSGEGLTSFIEHEGGATTLGGMAYGDGYVMFGGLTSPNFHAPQPQANILEANILDYVHSFHAAAPVAEVA